MWTLDPEIRWRYVQGMTRLSVWYVRSLLERGEITKGQVPAALSRRVDLYRLTDLWDGTTAASDGLAQSAWRQLAEQMAGWICSTPFSDVSSLEERSLALLTPSLEARLPKDVGPPPARPFACWTYDLGWEGLGDRPGLLGKLSNKAHVVARLRRAAGLPPAAARDAVLHVMNVMVPRSPFDDMPMLTRTLLSLLAQIREQHPAVRELWCDTWLNDHPRFREIFPQEWFASAVISRPGNYRNWWGQFARRDGDFNEAAAQQFRLSGGVFRYRALLCHANLNNIEQQLRSHLSP